MLISRCYLEIAIAKRCRLHKLIRQRFALALKIQQEDFALITSRKIQSRATVDPDASNSSIQSRAYMNQLLLYIQSQALEPQTQEKKKQAKCRNSTSRELQYPVAGNLGARFSVIVINQQRSS
ncbi:hypothetical protein F511_25307 [Dorcoceras hygrometricum]|uniref:Uncharacterized protein n=1 Tax=Dorcoceras hygrometricum TaxID=472368 RepID=A0A2Z7CEN1_9LAMI|nr:hypothetical protein F511_25307 [Dorcoceras hygrometricum]